MECSGASLNISEGENKRTDLMTAPLQLPVLTHGGERAVDENMCQAGG